MIRILQLSDVHFGGEDAAAVAAAAAYARDDKPDLVILTGDITLNGLPREFEAAAAWIKDLPKPCLSTPGNHDTPYWNIPLRALVPFGRYRRWIGPASGENYDAPGVRLRTITTARGAQPRPDWSKGAIDLDLCREAAAEMAAEHGGALRLIACHHPLVEAIDTPVSGGVHRGEEAAGILCSGGVDAILTGHVHNPFAMSLSGCGDGRTYAIGAGTLSIRTRGTPPSFNCISADDETITVTAMGWTGSHFEPYRTWALPRRIAPEA